MKKLCFLLLLIPFISLSQTTYYKYAPRQETSQVNYAKVGQDINNTLNISSSKRTFYIDVTIKR